MGKKAVLRYWAACRIDMCGDEDDAAKYKYAISDFKEEILTISPALVEKVMKEAEEGK